MVGMMDNVLCTVQRPSRYLGNELNVPEKDWSSCRVRIALALPDVYEVGMSHPGLLLLYDILNRCQWIGAERVFAPWSDMEDALRLRRRPLVSLESSTPLALFDIVGFSLQYELGYTNVLTMLELGGIPLLAADRGVDAALVIGGGPCAFNPEPVAPFFDAFALGDGEELVLEIAATVDEWKSQGGTRLELLRELSQREGVYVPAFFRPRYTDTGRIEEIVPRFPEQPTVRKRILASLDESRPTSRPVVPYAHIVHDRLNVEVVRGCSRGCRFCLAGTVYRPVRERSPQEVLRLAQQALGNTGYDELSLLALSVGDYSCIHGVLQALTQCGGEEHLAVSLPSLRVGSLDEAMIKAVRRGGRKTGFTVAPEAGSERLRRVINKGISEENLLETVRLVYGAGWPLLKLYFMMGLPTERMEDREALSELSLKVAREAARHGPGRRLHVSVSPFVPKAHTPFQWESQLSLEEMEEHLAFFKTRLRRKGVQLKWHQPWQSVLEGIFARGDRRLAEVLLQAQRLGCRFDGWSDLLRPRLWRQAFAGAGVDPTFYNLRSRGAEEVLPWSHLDCRVRVDYLWREYERALAEEATPDCRLAGCTNCGICEQGVEVRLQNDLPPTPLDTGGSDGNTEGCHRYGLVFAKTGRARFLGHLEVVRVFQRAVRRAGLPVAYSQGYHPSPRISFEKALPLGIESHAERMEVVLSRRLEIAELYDRLNAELPRGLEVLEVRRTQRANRDASPRLVVFEATLNGGNWPPEGFRRFETCGLTPLRQQTKRGEVRIPLTGRLVGLEAVDSEKIRLEVTEGVDGHIRVRELLAHVFGLTTEQLLEARIVKLSSEAMKG
jgi:radical SAM family uncharacterized protein/radical SAM-linked protein